ncbi:hypothetical protein ABZX12_26240 [Kribbella sp. NPDC003505]
MIDEWLRSDLVAPRKQRQTAKRILAWLLDEQSGAHLLSDVRGRRRRSA